MTFATASVVLCSLCIVSFYCYKKWRLNVFKRMGIDGPSPNLILGNLHQRPLFKSLKEWTKKYGKFFGYYEGHVPILVTSDLDFLKQVFVKKFSMFHARKNYPLQPDPDDDDCSMFVANGERWKRLRSIISPSFSTVRMKQMAHLMNRSVDDLMDVLDQKCTEGKPFDIHLTFGGLTMDVIAECAFGIQAESQKNPKDDFLQKCQKIFLIGAQRPLLMLSAMLFPELRRFWLKFYKFLCYIREDPTQWVDEALAVVMEMRRKEDEDIRNGVIPNTNRRVDLLQLMLDAEEPSLSNGHDYSLKRKSKHKNGFIQNGSSQSGSGTTTPETSESSSDGDDMKKVVTNGHSPMTANGNHGGVSRNGDCGHCYVSRRALSKKEINAQCTLFLLAGYETTNNALAYTAYELALSPRVQRRVQEEIDEHGSIGVNPDHATLQKLTYMDMVICEVLRKYPLASPVTNRQCTETCDINGIKIPAGMVIQPDVWSIHYDKATWGPVDPHEFYPERFSPENKAGRHPLAFLAFGAGPRNCVGMRFAFIEIKIALYRLLQKYTIVTCEETQIPLNYREGGTVCPADVTLAIRLR